MRVVPVAVEHALDVPRRLAGERLLSLEGKAENTCAWQVFRLLRRNGQRCRTWRLLALSPRIESQPLSCRGIYSKIVPGAERSR